MKNTKTMIAAAMMAMTITTFASANNSVNTISVEDKATVSILNKALPASIPTLETPAPAAKVKAESNNQSATQKATIVGLKLKSISAK
jgi:hypothetical protein